MKNQLNNLNANLHGAQDTIRSLRKECDAQKSDLARVRKRRDSLKGELAAKKGELEKSVSAHVSTQEELVKTVEELARLAGQCERAEAEASDAKRQLAAIDRAAIRAEAVKEYRASREFWEDRDDYAAGFIKYGFYKARGYLESQHPGQTFPELVYCPEAEEFGIPDWRVFGDPDPMPSDDALPELSRPSGPWTPKDAAEDADGEEPEARATLEAGAGTGSHAAPRPEVEVEAFPTPVTEAGDRGQAEMTPEEAEGFGASLEGMLIEPSDAPAEE